MPCSRAAGSLRRILLVCSQVHPRHGRNPESLQSWTIHGPSQIMKLCNLPQNFESAQEKEKKKKAIVVVCHASGLTGSHVAEGIRS